MVTRQKYPDIPFFLIAIAFISAFNYYLTYTNITLSWYTLFRYTLDTLTGYFAWWAVRAIVIRMDQKMPYGDKPLKRILSQLVVTTISGVAVIILITELLNIIVTNHPVPLNFYLFDVFIFVIWFFVINGIYIGMHYYAEWKASETRRQEEKKVRTEGFNVKHGKQTLLIPFSDIFGLYVEDGYTILLTRENKKYYPDKSLDKIEETLPGEWFFRLNRQYILHRTAVTGFKRAGDGKIDVLVNAAENFPGTIQVSRLKAVAFKNWFDPE